MRNKSGADSLGRDLLRLCSQQVAEGSLIRRIPRDEVQDFLSYAKGRMAKKVMGAQEALRGGVGQVVFADSRAENPVRGALAGEGTVIG